jgi:predicted Zn-dependent peptidase
VNEQAKLIRAVTTADMQRVAQSILREENSSVLYYRAEKK